MKGAVSIVTLGCKVNQQESEALAREFAALGFAVTNEPGKADAVIVNSCTVTRVSDQKTRQMARRAKAENPAALVFVIGCYPQIAADELLKMPEVDGIVPATEKERTAQIVAARTDLQKSLNVDLERIRDAREKDYQSAAFVSDDRVWSDIRSVSGDLSGRP